ncbi:hypothetical protein HanPSC8_Chr11g0451821 [Helianthus annuus]|nr:hypothetical protein HanPSC8_Chr11g0451821 [Helianthus annuus]
MTKQHEMRITHSSYQHFQQPPHCFSSSCFLNLSMLDPMGIYLGLVESFEGVFLLKKYSPSGHI